MKSYQGQSQNLLLHRLLFIVAHPRSYCGIGLLLLLLLLLRKFLLLLAEVAQQRLNVQKSVTLNTEVRQKWGVDKVWSSR